jgi:hypothetical protein
MPTDESGRAIAGRIEERHPGWVVQFGTSSREYLAVTRSGGPRPVRLGSRYPGDLVRRMRDIELHDSSLGGGVQPEGQEGR